MKKDSYGNPLPKQIMLSASANQTQVFEALRVNSFLLTAEGAIKAGHTVIYSAANKKADIIERNGNTSTISH